MQPQNPNPYPDPTHIDPYSQYLYSTSTTTTTTTTTTTFHYSSYHSQLHLQNPNPIEPVEYGYESFPTTLDFSYTALTVPSTYYNSATGFTITPNGTKQLVSANPNSTLPRNQTTQPRKNSTWKKGPKKTKVVQSVRCEICKINCDTLDVLDKHKSGKKHRNNLEKLKEATDPAPAPAPSPAPANPIIGPQEKQAKSSSGKKAKKKAAEAGEDLATKRRKLMEGGSAAEAVRACAVCNVVCNGETSFRQHRTGQKHAAVLKKLASGTGVAATT